MLVFMLFIFYIINTLFSPSLQWPGNSLNDIGLAMRASLAVARVLGQSLPLAELLVHLGATSQVGRRVKVGGNTLERVGDNGNGAGCSLDIDLETLPSNVADVIASQMVARIPRSAITREEGSGRDTQLNKTSIVRAAIKDTAFCQYGRKHQEC
jgi:hypothetical protein